MLFNREEMLNELRQGVILVNFDKVDGTKRDMRCTLNADYLAKELGENTIKPTQTVNEETVIVYDTEKSDWRSFRLDRVNHVFNPAP